MPQLLGRALLEWLDRSPAWTLQTEKASLSAADFRDLAIRRALELRRHHSVGSRVAVSAGRGAAYWIDLAATWLADCVAVPVPADASEAARTAVRQTLSRPSWGEAAVWFTSGSTGTPKGALLTSEALLANAEASASRLALPEGARLFAPIPFTFVSSLSHFLVSLRSGASFLGFERPCFPGTFLKEADRLGADALGGAPLHARWALDSDRPWRWMMSSGDRLSPDTVAALRGRFPTARIHVVYGMTELGGRAFCLDAREGASDTVGKALPCLLHRLDPATGEVQFSGSSVMLGYDGLGREGFTRDGWLRSGDVGELDESGRLRLLGRTDDVFKCAGNKVSGLLIADALWKTGEFADLAVVPVDHSTLGRVPHAYVVPRAADWEPAATLGKLRGMLSPDQLPHGFTRVTSIPRTGSGKLQRRSLPTEETCPISSTPSR